VCYFRHLYIRSVLLWDIPQRRVAILYRFGTTFQSQFHGSSDPWIWGWEVVLKCPYRITPYVVEYSKRAQISRSFMIWSCCQFFFMTRPVKNNPQYMCVFLACPLGQLQIYLYLVSSIFLSCHGCLYSCYMLECLNAWIFTHKGSLRCRSAPIPSPFCRVVSAWKNGVNRLIQVGLNEWNMHKVRQQVHSQFSFRHFKEQQLAKAKDSWKDNIKIDIIVIGLWKWVRTGQMWQCTFAFHRIWGFLVWMNYSQLLK
jgi:hypothetical protein